MASLISCGILCLALGANAVQFSAAASTPKAHLVVHRKTQGLPEVLAQPAAASAQDLLQLSYVSAGRRHGVILSIDGKGSVTLHSPSATSGDTALLAGNRIALDRSFELDDAPTFERFIFVTSDSPIRVGDVVAAGYSLAQDKDVAQVGHLVGDPDWDQSFFLVHKVTRKQARGAASGFAFEETLP